MYLSGILDQPNHATLYSSINPYPVRIHRLTIQITHEWTTPGDQTLSHMRNRSGEALEGASFIITKNIDKNFQIASYPGNSVAVYQDAFFEMSESTDNNPYEDKAEPDGKKEEWDPNDFTAMSLGLRYTTSTEIIRT